MPLNKQQIGKQARKNGYKAENIAVWYLRFKGYKILERNFKPPRGSGAGEIDIIASKRNIIVFIEVKSRSHRDIAAESVTERVRARRIKGAEYFLMTRPDLIDKELRFDVILISPGHLPEHIVNAFMCS
ncbi:MAG: YraN family protein [Alphaproteobacteria bacterium]|nr:YraN family protein [Alphaproteobacteria bacterium]